VFFRAPLHLLFSKAVTAPFDLQNKLTEVDLIPIGVKTAQYTLLSISAKNY
jgi:hypothetical protein